MTSNEIRIRHHITAPRDQVYKACSHSGLLEQWFYPGGVAPEAVTNSLSVSESNVDKDALFRQSQDPSEGKRELGPSDEYYHVSKILEMSPSERIVLLWSSKVVRDSKVTINLREEDGQTVLELTHQGLDSENIRETLLNGWVESLALLTMMLEASE